MQSCHAVAEAGLHRTAQALQAAPLVAAARVLPAARIAKHGAAVCVAAAPPGMAWFEEPRIMPSHHPKRTAGMNSAPLFMPGRHYAPSVGQQAQFQDPRHQTVAAAC
jgi:hypothetical protein